MAKSDKKEKSNAGAPTKYLKKYDEMAYKLCLLGSTDEEMASIFDVSVTTLNTWKKEYPQFLLSIKKGKDIADSEVASSLFKRANGFEYTEIKEESGTSGEYTIDKTTKTTKYVVPDTGAGAFWLKNRKRTKWNERDQEETKSDDRPILEGGEELPSDE